MRRLVDILMILGIAALIMGVAWKTREDRARDLAVQNARASVQSIAGAIILHSVIGDSEKSEAGYPATIDPTWFEGAIPDNPLIDDSHPWIEVASIDDVRLLHPRNRIILDSKTAKFWYNPYTGVVRGRVPSGMTDVEALELYNFINDSELRRIFHAPNVDNVLTPD